MHVHSMAVTQPSGMRYAAWSAAWNWFSTSTADLPPLAHVPLDLRGIGLQDVHGHVMFDPRVHTTAHLPWAAGSTQPPPALMPPRQGGFFRRMLGGGR
jgi:hypothetical protein